MNTPIKILFLDDSKRDAELLKRHLVKAEMNFISEAVQTRRDYETALDSFKPDIIVSDYSLPSFTGINAFHLKQQKYPDIPFIIVSGTIGEERAVEIMKEGVSDYLLKDRLQRLPSAILSALEKCRFKAEKEKYMEEIIISETLFKKAEKIAHFGIFESDLLTGIVKWSDELYALFGYEKDKITPSLDSVLKAIHPDDLEPTQSRIGEAIKHLESLSIDFRVKDKDGRMRYIHDLLFVERDATGKPVKVTGFNQDITKEKEASIERDKMNVDLTKRNEELEQFSFIVSHNLRAPLANIKGILSLLKNEEPENGDYETMFAGLEASVNSLDNVILDLNHILNVRGGMRNKKETVVFEELVNEIKLLIADIIEKEKVEIITNFSETDRMETNRGYMHSIFYNLITNSIHYRNADAFPVIKITCRKMKDKIRLLFEDNGKGIDLSAKGDKIFKLYSHFPNKGKGKGKGLFMVKTQVEALNGTIKVKSEVNKGTEFKIEFER